MTYLYNQTFNILKTDFDKSTKRFLDRQIMFHLSKKPEELEYSDKGELAKWIRISSSLLFGKEKAAKLYKKIMEIEPQKNIQHQNP